jgi:uncharacterized protein involved in outer membrane biogenesis
MISIVRRLIRLALYLCILLIVLVVAAVLLLNTIVKEVLQSRLRASTGMDARIGQIDVGLLSPTLTIENFKLYNTADFGGSLFIDMPELHLEYDPVAIRSGNLHFKLVRLNLAEIALVRDKKGRSNTQALEQKSREASGGKKSSAPDFKFTGIDTLNLTLGKFRLSNLASSHEEEIKFDPPIKNQISHNVKSENDVPALNTLLATRTMTTSSSTNSPLNWSTLLQSLTAH